MPLTFPPRTEAEVSRLFKDGIYEFDIIKSEEKTSKSGNLMLALSLRLFGEEGRTHVINDYILTDPSFEWKLRHFAFSCGLGHMYDTGKLADVDCLGKHGKVQIKTEISKDPQYKDKNVVVDYIMNETQEHTHGNFNDDIPF